MKYILITGAARGIGYGLAQAYGEGGYYVVAGVRNSETENVRRLKATYGERFLAVEMDVSSTPSVIQAAEVVKRTVPYLDIIINNAATHAYDTQETFETCCVDNCLEVFNVNTLGPLRVTQAFFPLLERGTDKLLVNISSNAASIGDTTREKMLDYCMSKAALNMESRILQNSFHQKGIKVLALHPGWVRTDSGGPNNPLSPEESAAYIMRTADKYKDILYGPIYIDYTGKPMNY